MRQARFPVHRNRLNMELLEDRSVPAFDLAVGQAVFWDGVHSDREIAPLILTDQVDPSVHPAVGPHWEYDLRVTEAGGHRLRVAIDMVLGGFRGMPDIPPAPDPGGNYRMQVFDPADRQVANEYLFGNYTSEVFVPTPEVGTYTVRVSPSETVDRSFRMRAKLEAAPATPSDPQLLYPNLRITPAFEPSFVTPTVGFGPGVQVPGVSTGTIMPEEYLDPEDGRQPTTGIALHFSAGVENVGAGPLWIDTPDDPVVRASNVLTLPARQAILDTAGGWHPLGSDGSAGEFELHAFHHHYHYQGIYSYELWGVANPAARSRPQAGLTQIGTGHKLGFLPADERMADWQRFDQEPRGGHDTGRQDDPTFLGMGGIGLSAGWSDLYEWNRSGQYVDFPATADGRPQPGYYVIRGTADAAGLLVESNERDNVSYTYIHVDVNGRISVLERGFGSDPWDRHQIEDGPVGSAPDPDEVIVGPITVDDPAPPVLAPPASLDLVSDIELPPPPTTTGTTTFANSTTVSTTPLVTGVPVPVIALATSPPPTDPLSINTIGLCWESPP